jgi:hypothetical protein
MMKAAIRRDAESGRPAHAHRPESLPPRTSSLAETPSLPAAEPAVEIIRPRSAPPPAQLQHQPASQPYASSQDFEPSPSTQRYVAPTSAAPRQTASTVRMINAPPLPGEAPAPMVVPMVPPPSVSPSTNSARTISATPGTLVRGPSEPPPPGAPIANQAVFSSRPPPASPPLASNPLPPLQASWRPPSNVAPSRPPPAVMLSDEPVPPPRSKATVVLIVAIVALLVGLATTAVYFSLTR